MNLGLNGRKALVTGSTHGIGKGIARTLLEEGCVVAVTGREPLRLSQTVKELCPVSGQEQVVGLRCDFENETDIRKLTEQLERLWGQIDILVCNVGSGRSVPPLEENVQEWRRMAEINLFTATSAVQYCLPLLAAAGNASIILIASICGVEALGAPVAYSVAKSGVIALAANMAAPLGKLGIRINAVSPGNIIFPGSVWEDKSRTAPEKVKALLESDVPLGRFGEVDDIGNAVAFLASDRAGFVTGINMVVDGGQTRSI